MLPKIYVILQLGENHPKMKIVFLSFLYVGTFASPVLRVPQNEDDFSSIYFSQFETGIISAEGVLQYDKTIQLDQRNFKLFFFSRKTNGLELNITNEEEIKRTDYSSSKETVFLIHGWTNDHTSRMCQVLTEAYLKVSDVNIFVVDWSSVSKQEYVMARYQILELGKVLGTMISTMVENNLLNLNKTTVVGHSLGAHLAGTTGKALEGKVGQIIGLDPAGPFFFVQVPRDRLDQSDAKFVQVLHTCAGRLGFDASIGHADYWANGGKHQNGCIDDIQGSCSHHRAYFLLAESLQTGNFIAWQCDRYDEFELGLCKNNTRSYFGQLNVDKSAEGNYYLDTNAESPYAKGGIELRNTKTVTADLSVTTDLALTDVEESDITFYFYNRTVNGTLLSKQNLSSISFDPLKKTRFIIHGASSDYTQEMPQTVKDSYLNATDMNLILVDWSRISNLDYFSSKSSTPDLGNLLGQFIELMSEGVGLNLNKTGIVGHSLGAHMAGVAGRLLNGSLSHIVGLDPAGPLYNETSDDDKLDPSDAQFVQVIHTNGGFLGYGYNMGDADFYPNGGLFIQPGCNIITDTLNACSHNRSYLYYAESLVSGGFKAQECSDYRSYSNGLCSENDVAYMGEDASDRSKGQFYLDTNSESPFAEN